MDEKQELKEENQTAGEDGAGEEDRRSPWRAAEGQSGGNRKGYGMSVPFTMRVNKEEFEGVSKNKSFINNKPSEKLPIAWSFIIPWNHVICSSSYYGILEILYFRQPA